MLTLIGEEKILIESLNEIDFYAFEVLDFDIEKVQSNYRAKIYMLKTRSQKQFEDILIELLFKKSRTRFNELNDVAVAEEICTDCNADADKLK